MRSEEADRERLPLQLSKRRGESAPSLTQRQVAELNRSRRDEFKISSDICDCLCASVRTDGIAD